MRALLSLLVLAILTGCAAPVAEHADDSASNQLPLPLSETVIYELYVRSFTPEGTFRAIIPRLDELSDLGVTHIWFMPIHPVGEVRRKGTLGSPYSIADYMDVNPEFGTLDDFRELVDAIHDRGMFVMLDLVANHTAWDHPWVSQHPDWYETGDDGQITHPPGTDWTDVAQLDFDHPDVRRAMRAAMRFWVEDVGIDGYRADVAELVPSDFWHDAIAELRDIRPVLMLAEGHDAWLHDAGFDLTYSWTTYHPLKDIWRGARADTLLSLVQYELDAYPLLGRLRFTTNHDETAWDATPVELFGGSEGARAAAVIAATLPGVFLLYNGQEVGDTQRLPLFERQPIDWDADPRMRPFYRQLIAARQGSAALREGTFEPIDHPQAADVVAFRRVADEAALTVVVNVRPRPLEVTLPGYDPFELGAYGWRIIGL